MTSPARDTLWSVPNLLSLSRLPLAVIVFALIAIEAWPAALAVFVLAVLTDWLDGWWARRFNQLSAIGRNLDPLTDKVLIGGTFIYLLPVEPAGLTRWMVTLIIGRELLITGLRGIVEATGRTFGADWFGKLKTVLQSSVLIGVFVLQSLRPVAPELASQLDHVQLVQLYAMLVATAGSAIQYLIKAVRILK